MSRRYSIYALVDPRSGRARYIGLTIDPISRLVNHIRDALVGQSDKDRWILSLLRRSLAPKVKILRDDLRDRYEASVWERWYITRYYARHRDLLNRTKNHLRNIKIMRSEGWTLERIARRPPRFNPGAIIQGYRRLVRKHRRRNTANP